MRRIIDKDSLVAKIILALLAQVVAVLLFSMPF
jgi:hypothetical protein